MAYSTKSFYQQSTHDSSRAYAKAAADNSYKYYNTMSWSMWVMTGPGNSKHIWSMFETASGALRSWLFSTQTDGTFRTIFSWDGTNFSLHKTATAVFDYSWKHIVVTFTNGTQTVYVNGTLQTMNQTIAWGGGAAGLYAANVQHMVTGTSPSAPPIDNSPGGCVQNFSLWSKVLSQAEVTELYNNGAPYNITTHSAAANLTNWLRMDQSDTAPTLVDSKVSGANATITASGTSGFFAASNNYPTYNTSPGTTHVETGTSWVYDGETQTGSYTGANRWSDPNVINVLSGVAYQANSLTNNKTGTLVSPTAAQNAAAVWDELLASHTTADTFGTRVKKLLTVAKFLGLK